MWTNKKQICASCHFFFKEARTVPDGPFRFVVSSAERELARKGDYSWHTDMYVIGCHFGVWDEGNNFNKQDRHKIVVETARKDFCFFFQHHPGMLFPAAKVLQERASVAREASRDRRLTIYGLWIAAIALAANVILGLAKELKWWPFSN